MSKPIQAHLIEHIDVADELGEGVLWRAEDQTLWWTDILGYRIHRLQWPKLRLDTFPMPERLGSFGFVKGDCDRLVGAFETGFALFYPSSGECEWLARPSQLGPGRRLNDGRVGPDGRFWAGSMIESDALAGSTADTGLYSLDKAGNADFIKGGFSISNGICWSPDGQFMYATDTPSQKIMRYRYNSETGELSDEQLHVQVKDGLPDGAVTDRSGNLWCALWGGAKIACFNTEGGLVDTLELGALQPTCPAFAGPELSLLAISTARAELRADEIEHYPYSGALLIYEGGFAGVHNTPYQYLPV